MTNFDIDEAVELFKMGHSFAYIAQNYGVHPYTIQSKLEEMGYYSKNRRKDKNINWDSEKAIEMRKNGFTLKRISHELNISVSVLSRYFIGIFGKKNYSSEVKRVSFDIKEAERLFKMGKKWTEIGNALKVHPFSVQRILSRLGYKLKNRNKYSDETRDFACALRKKGLSYEEISIKTNMSVSTVCRVINDWKKSKSEEKQIGLFE